jgi:hypothetical protein
VRHTQEIDVDPFQEAAMAELGGPAPGGPPPGPLPGGPLDPAALDGTVQCQVCLTVIDAADGTPVEPVDDSAVQAAQVFVAGGGAPSGAELGGVALGPGSPPPAF